MTDADMGPDQLAEDIGESRDDDEQTLIDPDADGDVDEHEVQPPG
jgi:hypothetical protein